MKNKFRILNFVETTELMIKLSIKALFVIILLCTGIYCMAQSTDVKAVFERALKAANH